jgi:hypothetical protein
MNQSRQHLFFALNFEQNELPFIVSAINEKINA